MALLGSISLLLLFFSNAIILILIALVLFGISFISLQSILVMTAQNTIPKQRGTAMSLASFNMFVGGAVATLVNGFLVETNISVIFLIAAGLFVLISFIAPIAINRNSAQVLTNPQTAA